MILDDIERRIQRLPKVFLVPAIISGTSTEFKFGRYIQKIYPNKSPLKRSVGMQGLPNVFNYPLLSQERVKLRISNFACTFVGSIGTKSH